MFGRRKRSVARIPYDKTGKVPVLRCSICTGEQVAGFRDSAGHFEELLLIRNGEDLREFMERYQVKESELRREW